MPLKQNSWLRRLLTDLVVRKQIRNCTSCTFCWGVNHRKWCAVVHGKENLYRYENPKFTSRNAPKLATFSAFLYGKTTDKPPKFELPVWIGLLWTKFHSLPNTVDLILRNWLNLNCVHIPPFLFFKVRKLVDLVALLLVICMYMTVAHSWPMHRTVDYTSPYLCCITCYTKQQ